MMSKWILENIFVITHPKNTCVSRFSLGLPWPRCAATSHSHGSPSLSPANNGCRAQVGERGALYVGLPGTDRPLPGMAENRKKIEILALPVPTHLLLYIHPCTIQEQTLYHRIFCCMIRTAVHIYCCVRTRRAGGVERRGEVSAPLWHGSAYHCCYFFVFCFFVRSTLPCLWHNSAFVLLYSPCCTIIVHTLWVRGWLDAFVLLRAVLYNCCTTYCYYCAVVQGGWVDRFVGVPMGSWGFFFCDFFSPLYQPRPGIVRRTTNIHEFDNNALY